MAAAIDKRAIVDALAAALAEALAAARAAHAAAIEGATHAEARPENDKDTRGLEQSYLARGQAQRVAELEVACATVAKFAPATFADGAAIALGALVTTEDDDGTRARLFLAPAGGGTVLTVKRASIQVVTPQSPLGRELLGKTAGDDVELRVAAGARTLAIVEVA